MSSHTVTHLVHVYGVVAVFAAAGLQAAGVPLPGTTVLIAAALYAGSGPGRLSIVGVILAGALGALAGTCCGYGVGRWRGVAVIHWVGRRLRQGPLRVERLRAAFAARAGLWLFAGRFITGGRNVTGLLAGTSGMAPRRFLIIAAAASLVWAGVSGLEYYWFGRALAAADTWVQILLVAVGVLSLLLTLRWMRRRALTGLLEPGDAAGGGR